MANKVPTETLIQAFTRLAVFLISQEIPFTFQELGDDVLLDPNQNIELSSEQFLELITHSDECTGPDGETTFELKDGVEDCFYEILESTSRDRRYAPDIRVRFRESE